MSINSIELTKAIRGKDINGVIAAIKKALDDAINLMKKKCLENSEFNIVRWSNSASSIADEIVLKSKIKNAITALNNTIEINKVKCSAANSVASYLTSNDTIISLSQKEQWAGIILDMIIIGCDYHQLNSLQIDIIGYLTRSNTSTAKQILSAYDNSTKKFNSKKLLELKGKAPEAGAYQSLADVMPSGTLFNQVRNGKHSPLSNSLDGGDGQKRTLTPDSETALLIDKRNSPINSTEDNVVKSRCCWPF